MSAEYGGDQIQILEGLEAVRKKTGNVYRQHFCKRTSPPCVRDRRQCGG